MTNHIEKNIMETGTLPTGTIQLPIHPTEILELTPEQLEFALERFEFTRINRRESK
jgi:hypothetical protein